MQSRLWKSPSNSIQKDCCVFPETWLDADRKFTGVHFWEDYNPITERWYTIQSMAIKWLDGRWAIMELATDITTRKQVELELILAKEKAEESDRLKSAFLANMSHEIRTPLNAIVGFSSLLAEADDDERESYMSLVEENNELLLNLISDILDISKIEAGTVELIITRVDVARLCREVISTCSHKKHEEAVGLRFDESSPQIMVDADKNRIMQVLSNFITNALKFTTKGSVTLSYRLEDDGLLQFFLCSVLSLLRQQSRAASTSVPVLCWRARSPPSCGKWISENTPADRSGHRHLSCRSCWRQLCHRTSPPETAPAFPPVPLAWFWGYSPTSTRNGDGSAPCGASMPANSPTPPVRLRRGSAFAVG